MNKVGRNQPCPCGSGKKHKQCCLGKTPRKRYIEGVSAPVGKKSISPKEVFTMHMPASGAPELRLSDGTIVSFPHMAYKESYDRNKDKSDKVLNQTMLSEFNLDFLLDPSELIRSLRIFDMIFVIDTNTNSAKNGELISVSGISRVTVRKGNSDACSISCYEPVKTYSFKFDKRNGPEEKQAIMWLIEVLKKDSKYSDKLKIAIVTDHDLYFHLDYNHQKKHFLNNQYLPDNFQLLLCKLRCR